MKILKLVSKNALRRRLRTFLTILGLALAVMAFGLIRTFIKAWYAGAEAASPNRLITRHAVSIIFDLPIAYKDQLLKIDGVNAVTYANWFGGIYVDPQNFFPQFAADHETFFDLYPEYIIPPGQFEAFEQERRGVIVGQGLVDRFGWKLGDPVNLIGTIYPGDWEFIIKGIYTGKDENIDETLFIFRFDYLDETMKRDWPSRAGRVGWYALQIDDPNRSAELGAAIDSRFDNSWAETKTETEKEFTLSFIQMSSAIILGLRIISFLIIGVILLILANTMAMTARERVSEYSFLRTLGFRRFHLVGLIFGESMVIAALGGLAGMGLLYMAVQLAGAALSQFFPGFASEMQTYILCMVAALVVGLLSAIFPTQRALRIPIVDGLRVVD